MFRIDSRNFDDILNIDHKFTGCVIDTEGDKAWYLNGKCHRTDGPAVEHANGDKGWYRHGKFHREDGPAVEYTDGDKSWYLHGLKHREDGPAYESDRGRYRYEEWWQYGELHREDGPAIIDELNGTKYWYLNGKSTTEQHVMRLHKLKGFINGN